MARAHLICPDGTKVAIAGTPEEVARLVERLSGSVGTSRKSSVKDRARKKILKSSGPVGYVRTLKEEGFFKSKRTLSDIQKKLEEKGHIYALTSLSPALLRVVRSRDLGRIKEGGIWKYVNR